VKPENQKPKALKAKAWKLMSELVRRKFSDRLGMCTCYTCSERMDWREIQAGHGIGGRGNYVLFLEEVIRPQCAICNIHRQGNYQVFIPRLIEDYGIDSFQEWVIESRKPFKRSKGDYVSLVYELQARLTDLDIDDANIS
jgi:hypothetical protein